MIEDVEGILGTTIQNMDRKEEEEQEEEEPQNEEDDDSIIQDVD